MKKWIALILLITLTVLGGCTSTKTEQPAPRAPQADTSHLTGEDKGLKISVSKELRNMTQLIPSTKEGYDVVSILVKLENDTNTNIPISPDYVTLKTADGTEYKHSLELTKNSPLGKSAFVQRQIPPDYQGGGLLLFEIKKGDVIENLIYTDESNHNITIKFPTGTKTTAQKI